MKSKIVIAIFTILVPLTAAGKEPAKPLSVDTIQVLRISGQDQRAVIRTRDGGMQVIKPGDVVGNNRTVEEIAEGRVVLDQRDGDTTEIMIIRLEHRKQRVELIKRTPEKRPQAYAAQTLSRGNPANMRAKRPGKGK